MDLWIRSQDKRILQKVDNVYLNANYENRRICTNDSRDYESDLGEYSSKERALEVLDEIQKLLMPVITYTQKEPIKSDLGQGIYQIKQDVDLKIQQLSTYVYEMPIE